MGIPVEVLPFRLWLLIEMEWIKEMKSRKRTKNSKKKKKMVRNKEMEELKSYSIV